METVFPCYIVVKEADGTTRGMVQEARLDQLPPGEVLIRVAYSSLNFKDALACTGHPGVARKLPLVPGIDLAGTVESSVSRAFQPDKSTTQRETSRVGKPDLRPGQEVLVTGFDQGTDRWGGYAGFARVPAEWVIPLPAGMTLKESMILGTAGLTAALAVDALMHRGVEPDHGDIVVTGATGGVGGFAVALLAQAGFRVVAVSGKPEAGDYLRGLGAAEIIPREAVVDESTKPLLPSRWRGGIDTVGGKTLETILRSTTIGGVVAACGLVGGTDLSLTIYPFILRGVDLIGMDTAWCPMDRRRTIWTRLAGPWKLPNVQAMSREITLSQLDEEVARILAGKMTGRVVVRPQL